MIKKMSKYLIIVFFAALVACSIVGSQEGTIDLPEGITPEKASKIATAIWDDHFSEKITKKFPHFDPINAPDKYGIFLTGDEFTPKTSKGEKRLSIKITIYYKGKLDDAKEIVEYGKSIVNEELKKHLK
jgi:hypothetical protein